MERFFNIAGPCVAADHYMLPATERLPEVLSLIRKKLYFVIHAPRVRAVVEPVMLGKDVILDDMQDDVRYVLDPDLAKPWDAKIATEDVVWQGRSVHVVKC